MSAHKVIELKLPSELGYEKIAIASASSVAKKMGFSEDRIEDLKTAVGEACINAIEHGNRGQKEARVIVIFREEPEQLEVSVKDQGKGINPLTVRQPSLEKKMGSEGDRRGWGVFLIKSLTDEVEFNSSSSGGEVRMIIRMGKSGNDRGNH